MSDYIPLELPNYTATPNFANSAQFLRDSAAAIVRSGNSYLTDLAALKAIEYSQVGDLPNYQSVVLLADMSAVGNRPVRPIVDLDISDLQAQLRRLTVPPAPSANFSYEDPGYSSLLRDTMVAKLLNDLIYGGYGIETNDEAALWNRARDRESLETQANIDELRRSQAALGFTMPQGALYAALQKARELQLAKNSSVNRDIGLKRADLYVANRNATFDRVLKSEEMSQALYNAIQNRTLEAAQVQVKMAIALFEAGIRYFEGQLKAILSQIEAEVTAAKMQVDLYGADVAAYAAYVNAIAEQGRITIANSHLAAERDKTAYLGKVEIVKFRLQELLATVEKNKQINEFGVELFRTGLGSTLQGINGLAVQSGTV